MALVQKLADEEGWRRCYRCHTMVEHKNACRHITCRCGADWCYICGKVWWTCGCTERQLDRIKKRAKANERRRMEQEERERREVRELHQALEAIAKMEAAEAEKLERIRAAKESRRKTHVRRMHAEERSKLDEVNDFQRDSLDGQHRRDREHLSLKIAAAMDDLGLKLRAKLDQIQAIFNAEIEWEVNESEKVWHKILKNDEEAETN